MLELQLMSIFFVHSNSYENVFIFILQSDIFSLGIILLELLIPFNTDMERLKIIEAARKGIFPSNIPPNLLTLLKSYVICEIHFDFSAQSLTVNDLILTLF